MSKTLIVALLGLLGLCFVGLAVYYWLTPANHLLAFLPGFTPDSTKIHFKHGLGALILGLGSWVLAWFQSAKRIAANPPATMQ